MNYEPDMNIIRALDFVQDAKYTNIIKDNIEDMSRMELQACYILIKLNYKNFEIFPKSLRNNVTFIKGALKINGAVLRFLPSQFRKNYNVVKLAIKSNGKALLYADKKFHGDIELFTLAAETCSDLFSYLNYDFIPTLEEFINFNV